MLLPLSLIIYMTGNKGFTIIELLIVVTVFSIVITSSVNLFGSAIKYQKKVMDEINMINGVSYAAEYMSRALRMATKDTTGDCIAEDSNFEIYDADTRIRFLNYNEMCWEFFLEDGEVKIRGFGSFEVKLREARVSKQPRTGADVHIPEAQVVRFRQSKMLFAKMNKGL